MSNTERTGILLLAAIVAAATTTTAPARADNAPVAVVKVFNVQRTRFGDLTFEMTFKNQDAQSRTVRAVRFAFIGVDAFGKSDTPIETFDCSSAVGYALGVPIVTSATGTGCNSGGQAEDRVWQLSTYGAATVGLAGIPVKVLFSDGSTWEQPAYAAYERTQGQ